MIIKRAGASLIGCLLLSGMLLLACSGSDPITTKKEAGVKEGGVKDGVVLWEGTILPDMKVGNLECTGILDCIGACGADSTCPQNCLEKGTSVAQAQILEITSCQKTAKTASCKDKCTTPTSDPCYACLDQACMKEKHSCLFGEPKESFGQVCNIDQAICNESEGQACVSDGTSADKGFCTYSCSAEELCPGAPVGTYSSCGLLKTNENQPVCAFLCKFKNQQYSCPQGMACSTQEFENNPGIYLCVVSG
jgi:hypothetical protein